MLVAVESGQMVVKVARSFSPRRRLRVRAEAPHYDGLVTGCSPQANHFFPTQSGKKAVSQCLRIAHFEQNFWQSIPSSQIFNRR
jgi:hypothetical protein